MYSINFRLRTEKTQSDKRKIYVRLKINGVCATDFATSIMIHPEQWDKVKQTIKGNTPLDYTNRSMLLKTQSDLIELIKAYPLKGAKEIRNMYVGKSLAPATLLKVYKKFIEEQKEYWNGTQKELSPSTIKVWYNCKMHLEEFLKGSDIDLQSVDMDFGHRLYLYLIKKNQKKDKLKTIGHDYAVRNLHYLNTVIEFAKRKRLVESNVLDIHDYKINKAKQIQALTNEQLEKLAALKFTGILEDSRIIFLCMAYCGLNFCDLHHLEQLKGEDVITLRIDRKKNNHKEIDKAIVPIFPELRKILELYNYRLPLHEIGTINRHLHTFESILDVDISITTYTARKTFAMLLSERGISIDVISKILGHTSVITTQRYYVKVSEKRIIEETKHLF